MSCTGYTKVVLGIPAICGFGPTGCDLYTPHKTVHMGELLQKILLLVLYLVRER